MSSDPALIRVLAVDDHKLIRRGVAGLLATEPHMRVVAEASNGREAVKEFRAHRPDVTLMDLQMPEMSGLDAIIAIRGEYPEAHIIVLTTYTGDVQALRALKAGARAYLLKETMDAELLNTIRGVHAGRKWISPEVSFQLAEHVTDDALTEREVRVLALIAHGKTNKEIAKRLSLSEAGQRSGTEYLVEARCERPYSGRDDRSEAGDPPSVRPHRKDARGPALGARG